MGEDEVDAACADLAALIIPTISSALLIGALSASEIVKAPNPLS